MKLLSLDIPWGAAGYVGAAYAAVQNRKGRILSGPRLAAHATADALPAPGFPAADPEILGFIQGGAGPHRGRPQDNQGPFFAHFPHDAASRAAYLNGLWQAFVALRARLGLDHQTLDLVVVDVPLVPAAVGSQPIQADRRSRRRPVEHAFEKKVWIPGSNPKRVDGRVNLGIFLSGNINGCRPGYAVARFAQHCFGAVTVVESFPQLTLGALAEIAAARGGINLITRLGAHKKGDCAEGQAVLDRQLALVVPQGLTWIDQRLAALPRADAYDAMLGLLPAMLYAGWTPDVECGQNVFRRSVVLRNLTAGDAPACPRRVRAAHHATGTGAWKLHVAADLPTGKLQTGIDDRGILVADLFLWQ